MSGRGSERLATSTVLLRRHAATDRTRLRPGRRASLPGMEPYLYLLPAVVFLAVFTYYPIARSAYLSLYRWDVRTPLRQYVGTANFTALLQSTLFWEVMRNTALFSAASVGASLVIALALALALNGNLRGRAFYRAAFFYPTIIPMVAASVIWVWVYDSNNGPLNRYLALLGLPAIGWLTDPTWALPSLVLMAIWKNVGYYVIIFLAGLQNIPEHLYEAALIEGASAPRRLRHITLPLLAPTTFFVFVISVITSFQVFTQVYMMTDGGPGDATNVAVFRIYQLAFRFWNIGLASALTCVLILVLLIAVAGFFWSLERKIHYQ